MSADRILSVECHPVAPRWIFLRVETRQGLVGWGEAIVPKRARAVCGAVADLRSSWSLPAAGSSSVPSPRPTGTRCSSTVGTRYARTSR